MGGNIQGRFADQDPEVLSGQVQTSNNNQITLNAALAETDHLRSTPVIFQPTGLLATIAQPVPNVAATTQGTIGAALGGIGQAGTVSEQPGGGGIPCFTDDTLITLANDTQTYIPYITCGTVVMAFDDLTGELMPKIVTDTQAHLVDSYCEVMFDDGTSTGIDAKQKHRYWTNDGAYESIQTLKVVYHWYGEWKPRRIIDRQLIEKQTILYNFTVSEFHNYIANGDAVSNLKPVNNPEF